MVQVLIPPEQGKHAVVLAALALPNLFVAVFGHGTPPEAEWQQYVAVMKALQGPPHRVLVFSAGGGPSALQRKDIEVVSKEHGSPRVATVTGDRIARGIVTALGWIRGETFKAFPPEDLESACRFIGLSDEEKSVAYAYTKAMSDRLNVTKELGLPGLR